MFCNLLQACDSLELTDDRVHAITDKIPQKPVTIVEGTSYMVIILGAFAVRALTLPFPFPCRPCWPLDPLPRNAPNIISCLLSSPPCTPCTPLLLLLLLVQVLGFFVYNFLTNFVLEPTYQTCFNAALAKLKVDQRITVRHGNDIVGEAVGGEDEEGDKEAS